MAVRIRKNGNIVCAAMNKELKGDLYIDDALHYALCRAGVLVTEPMKEHKKSGGQWWWITNLPKDRFLEGIITE